MIRIHQSPTLVALALAALAGCGGSSPGGAPSGAASTAAPIASAQAGRTAAPTRSGAAPRPASAPTSTKAGATTPAATASTPANATPASARPAPAASSSPAPSHSPAPAASSPPAPSHSPAPAASSSPAPSHSPAPAASASPAPAAPASITGGGPGAPPSSGHEVEGIDVSYYQGTIDWAQVKASGIGFAIARVSDGFFHDPQFARNWAQMKAHHLVRGAYQFFRGSHDGAAQANDFLDKFTLEADDLPPVADVEVLDGVSAHELAVQLEAWVAVVKRRTGLAPFIYTAPGLWNGWHMPKFPHEHLWVANWGVSHPHLPAGFTDWTMWQHSDNSQVPGISGRVDGDRFHGTLADLKAFVARVHGTGAAPAPAPAPQPQPTPSGKTYTVRAGDTLSGIAAQFGVTLAALEAANPQIANPNLIHPGEVVNIP